MAVFAKKREPDAPIQYDLPAKSRSRAAEVWHRLKKNRGAIVSLILISVLVLCAIFADVLYDYEEVVIKMNTPQRLISPTLGLFFQKEAWQEFGIGIFAQAFKHPFGTDELGRDILARVIHGTRISLSVGVVATLIGAVLGILLGAVAGYYGGKIEDVIMRIADIFIAIPVNLLAVVVVAALGQSIFNLMLAIGICSVPRFIRVTRSSIMSTRNQEYIEAERALGVRDFSIIFKTALPNSLSQVFVYATLNVATSIVSVSAMSFIGLGIPAPRPEWGSMLSAGRGYLRDYSYMTLFPGLAIMLTILSFNMMGDGLRDALDPKTKR